MVVMGDDWTWCGVLISMASVLELFNWRKFCFIQAFISSRQVVSVDGSDDDDGGGAAEGVGSVFR